MHFQAPASPLKLCGTRKGAQSLAQGEALCKRTMGIPGPKGSLFHERLECRHARYPDFRRMQTAIEFEINFMDRIKFDTYSKEFGKTAKHPMNTKS